MDLDLTGVWSWTAPLWGLAALVFFLVAVMIAPADILTEAPAPTTLFERLMPATPPAPAPVAGAAAGMIGGARRKRGH
jgi:hypothetical protein